MGGDYGRGFATIAVIGLTLFNGFQEKLNCKQQSLKMAQHIRDEFFQIPIVTRVYTSACILTTIAVVSPTAFKSPGTAKLLFYLDFYSH